MTYYKSMGMWWLLFDPNRETQSEKLTTDEAQLAIEHLKSKYLNRYLILNSEWTKWKQLNEFLRSQESPFTNNYNRLSDYGNTSIEYEKTKTLLMKLIEPREALKIHSTVSDINTNIVEVKDLVPKSKKQFNGDDLEKDAKEPLLNLNFSSLSLSSSFKKRNNEDKYKIQLLLIHPLGHTFRTTAKDISLTGTFNERIIPNDFHFGLFDLIIINNLAGAGEQKQIRLSSRIVSNDGVIYIQYEKPNAYQLQILRKVLTEYRAVYENANLKCG